MVGDAVITGNLLPWKNCTSNRGSFVRFAALRVLSTIARRGRLGGGFAMVGLGLLANLPGAKVIHSACAGILMPLFWIRETEGNSWL